MESPTRKQLFQTYSNRRLSTSPKPAAISPHNPKASSKSLKQLFNPVLTNKKFTYKAKPVFLITLDDGPQDKFVTIKNQQASLISIGDKKFMTKEDSLIHDRTLSPLNLDITTPDVIREY